ncbi:retinal-binding protein-like [Uloborus diversus]|uniref:retinal-binding protein-like n=1 Tax=Uloborus diversus TaxID=327109 RepID=UPI002409E9A0|nr:retinal-binding protein-like [Uloborus diversus]
MVSSGEVPSLVTFSLSYTTDHDIRRKKSSEPTPKVDKAKELEEEELAKLVELKENLGDDLPPQYSDAALLGFLRARSLNVKEAEKLMKLDVNVLRFLRIHEYELPEVSRAYSMSGILGYDNEGSLVRVVNVGDADFKGFVHSLSTIDEFRFFIWFFHKDAERLRAENKKTGRKNGQFVYILNFERMSIGQLTYKPTLDTGIIALKLLQDHYHDIAKAIYVINTPPFFSSVYKLIKPVIQDSLNKRMKIYGYDGWKEELLKTIDPEILPVYLGGSRVGKDDDPNCSDIISFGGTIPEHFYSNNFLDLEDPDVVTATVGAGSTLNFRFAVREVGTIFRWHIQAKDNDIGFGLMSESPTAGELEPFEGAGEEKEG